MSGINISVVISAKDEEKNVSSLIGSLKHSNYPHDCYEIIIADDHSGDNTFYAVEQLSSANCNIKIFRSPYLPGKKNALSFGISQARYPFILLTDADCLPSESWIKAYASKFREGYDVVFGAAPLIQSGSLINKISCFENLRASILSFTSASFGLPYSAFGRSLGFSRKAYNLIRGYKNTLDITAGDDGLLIREAVKNKLRIGSILSKNAFVYSKTKTNLREYLNQKARHTKTSFYYSLQSKYILSIWHILNLVFFFSPILMFIDWKLGIPFSAKTLFDFIVNLKFQKRFGYSFKSIELLFLQIIYELLLIVHFFNALFKNIEWKGRKI